MNGVHFALSFTRGLDNPRSAFYPALILAAWGLALLVGAEVEYPAL